jgi:hypothetical protein
LWFETFGEIFLKILSTLREVKSVLDLAPPPPASSVPEIGPRDYLKRR